LGVLSWDDNKVWAEGEEWELSIAGSPEHRGLIFFLLIKIANMAQRKRRRKGKNEN
jgi:hypothetical protein